MRNLIVRRWLVLAMSMLLAACSVNALPQPGASETPGLRPASEPAQSSSSASPLPTTESSDSSAAAAAQGTYFLIDQLVRSRQLNGIDMHVRYVERTGDGLVVHISFYNNRGEDLAYVSGAVPRDARLIGDDTYIPTATSESLSTGIDPEHGWMDGGATVGTLTFGGASGDAFTLEFPGFPAIDLALDQPVDSPPDAPPPPIGVYTYDLEVASPQLENIALRIEEARVEADALLLTIAFVNRNTSDISFTATVDGNDAVLFDGLWQQYQPGQVEQTLEQGINPQGTIWGEGESNQGTLTFPRPEAGDVVLFKFPSYPTVRIPLRSGAPASLAQPGDLPPSAAPRPTPTPQPTPTPLSGDALTRQQLEQTLTEISEALAQRDRAAYLAHFAPDLQQDQGALFDRIGELPLQDVAIEPSDRDNNGTLDDTAGEVQGYEAELSYRVQDVDPENIFSSAVQFTLTRNENRWQITALDGQLPFWAYGPTQATRSGAFWIFYRPDQADDLPQIEQEAQQAFDLVDQALPNRARPVNVMYITATEDEFFALTERNATRFLGVAAARYQIRKAGIRITSQAFYINGAAFRQDPQQDRQQTIAHELTHLVLSPQTMPYSPAWLTEGAAMLVSGDLPRDVLSKWYDEQGPDAIALDELSNKTAFGEYDVTGEQTAVEYAYSAFLARYIVDTYGQDKFFELYDSFSTVQFDTIQDQLPSFGFGSIFNAAFGNLAQTLTPEQVQSVLGVDLPTLERDYETWLGEQVAGSN